MAYREEPYHSLCEWLSDRTLTQTRCVRPDILSGDDTGSMGRRALRGVPGVGTACLTVSRSSPSLSFEERERLGTGLWGWFGSITYSVTGWLVRDWVCQVVCSLGWRHTTYHGLVNTLAIRWRARRCQLADSSAWSFLHFPYVETSSNYC